MGLQIGSSGGREYPPSEDTFFMADYIVRQSGRSALDVGSGSGYLTKLLEERFEFVACTDIDFGVLSRQTYPARNRICCNGADALAAGFDLTVCNMPYLATDGILDAATDGGRNGIEVPMRIINSVLQNISDGGKFAFVTSSLSDYAALLDYVRDAGMKTRIVARKKLFFEELMLAEIYGGPGPTGVS